MRTIRITTIKQAVDAIGLATQHGTVSSCGVHCNGQAWVGLGYHKNDDGTAVVAAQYVLFLPATLTLA